MSNNKLNQIIDATNQLPTIVNENSNFVVVTYYWGKPNYNVNTARPCISFFEDFLSKTKTLAINKITSLEKEDPKIQDELMDNIEMTFENYPEFDVLLNKFSKMYMNGMKDANVKKDDDDDDDDDVNDNNEMPYTIYHSGLGGTWSW